jgi:hypothetical protein
MPARIDSRRSVLADAGARIDDLREHPVTDFEQCPGTMRRWEEGNEWFRARTTR